MTFTKPRLVLCRLILSASFILLSGCDNSGQSGEINQQTNGQPIDKMNIIAVETFLADFVRNIAGDRLEVTSLISPGLDPHNYELTPQDAVALSKCDLIFINGGGYESWLQDAIESINLPEDSIIEASAGLSPKTIDGSPDLHFWMDPNLVIHYVENIRDALVQADPEGSETYMNNSEHYISQLKDLDSWIRSMVEQVPANRRVLVTNHESFGYFIDRYGFKLAGSILPSPSSEQAPSAQQMASLVDIVRKESIKAVFIETGANPNLAEQLATETGVKVISGLYTDSLSAAGGPAATYLDMMKYDVSKIVEALR